MLDEYLPQFARLAALAGRDALADYLQARLRDTERGTADVKAYAVRLAGELQAQTARADLLAAELDASKAALAQQQDAVGRPTDELKGQRLFAMQSIEMGHAETGLAENASLNYKRKIERLEMTIDQLRMARGVPGGMR